ncbi:MAG: VWA domain-containing protein [Acidobacteriota bacterium]|nr:VWA domain-containing protein [Acidobacteriota bacterium]
MRFYKILSALIFLFLCSTFLFAQNDDVINVDSTLVRLNVGVVNRSGQAVTNLDKNNFTLYENGVKQEITRFEPTVAPFSVVMILDMSGSTLGFRQTIQTSAFRFIDALSPDDRIAVIEFYDKVNVLNDFTSERKTLANSINVANGRGKTQLYKALDTALAKLSKEANRRKAIIVLTDGVDTAIREQDREILAKLDTQKIPNSIIPEKNQILNSVLNKASALGVTIYPLALPTGDPAKLADPTPIQVEMFQVARQRLKMLADRTGGTINTIDRLEQMGRLYARVAADVRSLYTIEYEPSDTKRNGEWREIKIEVNKPELISRTRPGYFAK